MRVTADGQRDQEPPPPQTASACVRGPWHPVRLRRKTDTTAPDTLFVEGRGNTLGRGEFEDRSGTGQAVFHDRGRGDPIAETAGKIDVNSGGAEDRNAKHSKRLR